jgi:hypothetical protein
VRCQVGVDRGGEVLERQGGQGCALDPLLRQADRLVSASARVYSYVDSHRNELLVHCYRLTGSVEEAEDLVQETPTCGRGGRATASRAGPRSAPIFTGSPPTPA